MPKIRWLDLPVQLRQHLFERAKERQLSMEDLFALEEWRRHSPIVPDGHWYKDFGSFKLCGEGHRIIASIVGNERDLIIERTRGDPGVGRLDRAPFSLCGKRNLGPFAAQLAADRQDNITCQLLG